MRTNDFRPSDDTVYLPGVEAQFRFNGLLFNDRREPERVRITRISGLDDPDVRDERQVNVERHGETPFSSFYGGRTITMTGYIEAGSMVRMRQLWQNFRSAFNKLEEGKLDFLFHDWVEQWKTGSIDNDWTYDTGSGTLTINGDGTLSMTSTAEKRLYMDRKAYKNFFNDFLFTVGATVSSSMSMGTFARRLDANNHLLARLSATALSILKYDGGSYTALANASYAPKANTDYWITFRGEDNALKANLWTADPNADDSTSATETTYTLAGGDATKFGTGISGDSGIRVVPSVTTGFKIKEVELCSLNEPDFFIKCRKVNKLESEETQSDWRYRRDFQLALRSSDHAALTRHTYDESASLPTGGETFPSDGSGLEVPLTFGTDIFTVDNKGSMVTYPTITFTGPCDNPGLINTTTGEQVIIDGNIASGSKVIVDCFERTVVDQDGNNKYSSLNKSSDWMTLEEGENDIDGGADAASGTVEITWRHAV